MFRKSFCFLHLAFIVALAGCGISPQYQDHVTIPHNQWDYSFQPTFKFNISDTSARYHMFFILRHTDAYPYNNLWVNMGTKGPGDSTFRDMRLDLSLTTPAGQWKGRNLGDIYEHRTEINSVNTPVSFVRPGEYTIRLSQIMRMDHLPELLQVGIRLEKLDMNSPTH